MASETRDPSTLHGWVVGISFDDASDTYEVEFSTQEPPEVELWEKATLIRGRHAADPLRAMLGDVVAALESADGFIRNGIEYGYIRMPDPDTPDSAHDTPGKVAKALARLRTLTPDGGS